MNKVNSFKFNAAYQYGVLLLLFVLFITRATLPAAFAEADEGTAKSAGAQKKALEVLIDGEMVHFDTPPLLLEEGMMLPLRAMGEQAGFKVDWENDTKRATLHDLKRDVALYPDNPLYAVNGILNRTAQPPLLRQGRLLVCLSFLEKGIGLVVQEGDPEKGYLHFKTAGLLPEEREDLPGELGEREQPVYFAELLLPPNDRVELGEQFEMRLEAPFVRGIYSYEVKFFYNPEIIQVKDVYNPDYRHPQEFYIKEINNREGKMHYTLTTLGARADLPSRDTLAVIEAVVSRAGAVPLIEGTLNVTMLDHRARTMPVGLEERVLYVVKAE